ncbi:hypothetical protein Aca07nite_38540 [Actinoplanes capillaceus]|uniref:Uncharacterized protein n=1 Tax=Actinoplanes campanulatus TaxID=113559 RepID=A0ABQ3WK11_9ACTN|nr:hypothetical protein [Actinoplanes capillaceus]GID46579.1 hypothetical protein Aca07nite_38540 [Actinoplanes capillaceus]
MRRPYKNLFDWITGNRPDRPVDQRLRPVRLLRWGFRIRDGLVRARLYATGRTAAAAASATSAAIPASA